ncbi:MAG: right-handed parallel beta-helix repeat-containing protein, partial [Actinomycetota bacterium]|nr:right-handed parallel beta-helix repeat-containing protein [Actinomycetota bacterium]
MLTDLRTAPVPPTGRRAARWWLSSWRLVGWLGLALGLLLAAGLVVAVRHSPQPPVLPRSLPLAAPIVDSALRNCVSSPSACGYPDASNTGVPNSTVLRQVPGQVSSGPGWHWDSRGFVKITGDNTVFSGFSVDATVDVGSATNVVISNNKITIGGDTFGVSLRHTKNAIVSHNTITGLAASG